MYWTTSASFLGEEDLRPYVTAAYVPCRALVHTLVWLIRVTGTVETYRNHLTIPYKFCIEYKCPDL